MPLAAKALRIAGLIVALLAGWFVIGAWHLLSIAEAVPVTPLGIDHIFLDYWDRGYVTASGTWVLEGEKHGFPLNRSEVRCLKDEGQCYSADAHIDGRYFSVALERYPISRWDRDSIEFGSDTATCVSYVYVLNRSTKRLTGRRLAKDVADGVCQQVVTSKDLRLSLTDGWDVIRRERDEAAPTIRTASLMTGGR